MSPRAASRTCRQTATAHQEFTLSPVVDPSTLHFLDRPLTDSKLEFFSVDRSPTPQATGTSGPRHLGALLPATVLDD